MKWMTICTTTASLSLVIAGLLVLAGCGDASKPATPEGGTGPKVSLPEGLFVTQAPDSAKDVTAAKQDAKPGEMIVVRGRIGGKQPFVKGRAALTLYDPALVACDEMPDHGCPTPWDFCCEKKESHVDNTASIQVLGPDGKVLAADLEGASGLAPLDLLVVEGTVDSTSQSPVLIVNAKSIFIEKRGADRKKAD